MYTILALDIQASVMVYESVSRMAEAHHSSELHTENVAGGEGGGGNEIFKSSPPKFNPGHHLRSCL